MKTELVLHERTLTLHRFPQRNNETLQAWDAGDEYLINHVEELGLTGKHILILNDNFGALSCWLSEKNQVTMMSDSFIAHQGTRSNLKRNHCRDVTLLHTMDDIPQGVEYVLMQIPRNNRHLVWQLSQLRQKLDAPVPVIAVNKAKEIHTSTLNLFEKYLGTTTTSLAWKKHRLVFSQADTTTKISLEPTTRWSIDEHDFALDNLPNVYSGEKLDQGARFMLDHLPKHLADRKVVDLGCGNGVLSVKLGLLNTDIQLTCVDESFMATESARRNLINRLGKERKIDCVTNNCLDGFAAESADFVVCNPPFHQQQAITDHIAWQMFCDAKHVLSKGGQLLVIGNRHLGYDVKLSKLFGKTNVKLVASNKKFVILQATK
ncbi:methyltransferase [Vibrio neptunius]|uniref:Ribosomal RNA large subunit methyltransferase G n=1 Tax=Vibrio neptunius TaxID=170651 RepID=A0ABS2ZZF2_9VIBR|nr:methyltransferase [Vibrio neptunius]MBN3491464.1 methyltransferase [Vibrio neptunius]MBN3513794.1 methyltransferase [Vibrio neptunius]MBN3548135.1 methyltransferase [Vibrio neptunius]MBN3576278.1 methyltransferase [Vibrio neptunius]MCH9869942.1 methyltransferase [Vibrio neptunius]